MLKNRLCGPNRGVAQSGSAPALGAGCRGFKSLCPDQFGGTVRRSLCTGPLAIDLDEQHNHLVVAGVSGRGA